MIDDGDCGAIGGMKIGRGNRSTRRKPASAPNSSILYIFLNNIKNNFVFCLWNIFRLVLYVACRLVAK
jgi:hypothetical protein